MNSALYVAALPILALTINAQTFDKQKLPDRPAAAVTDYKGNWLPVVGVERNAPVIVADGSPVTLGSSAGVILIVGDRYADGFVTVLDVYSIDVPTTNDPQTAATMVNQMPPTSEVLHASLTPNVDIPDAYAFLITYSPTKSPDAPPMLAVVVHSIGDLKAGVTTHLSAFLPKLSQSEGPGWSILVFDAGRQVRSTGMGDVLPGYFDRIETGSLKKRIAERLNKRADAPISVFRQMPLSLPEPIKAKYHGTTIKVEIRVSAEGRVISAKPIGASDAELWEALDKGFSTWLFLPALKDGAFVPASAVIPLKL